MPQSADCGIFKRKMVEILNKTENYVVIYKPAGIATQADLSGDPDAMKLTSLALDGLCEKSDLWLVHRLDRVVGGVVVFARNKEWAAILSELVGGQGMHKEYLAVVEGKADGGTLSDYIYKDSKAGKSFVVKGSRRGAKSAVLEYSSIASVQTEKGPRTLVRVKLHTGRFHQIRVQFSSRGMPLLGDGKYGSHDNKARMPALFSNRLAFNVKNKKCDVSILPDLSVYPWSLFDKELFYD